MLNVTYKPIVEYNNVYSVSSDGYVHNTRKQLKTFIINSGYEAIILHNGSKRVHHLVHRLVAQHFIPNPHNKREVNHIDGNKLNNNVCNLQWVTSSENKQHAKETGLKVYNNPTTGVKLGNTSKYHNVGYDKSRNRWRGSVQFDKKVYYQKRFDTEEEAALHVNWILDELNLTDRPRNVICN